MMQPLTILTPLSGGALLVRDIVNFLLCDYVWKTLQLDKAGLMTLQATKDPCMLVAYRNFIYARFLFSVIVAEIPEL